jgi:NitT/TauT family transport system substrate-binding protein
MKKILSLLLVLAFVFALAGCTTDNAGNETSSPEPTVSETPAASETPEAVQYNVNIGFLKGPPGIGAAYMLSQNEAGSCRNTYNVTLESDPTNITSAIISGELDLAAVPTNVAAALYNKTDGNVKVVALNTLGVLYILENGDTVSSVADLAGKTIYATGQGANPEYVLNYVLRQNGLEPGVDVFVEYMDSGELATQMAAGNIDLCMLPVPNSTSVLLNNSDVPRCAQHQ